MMDMRICLNMIIRDEAHIIESTLEHLRKYICYWVISDTGSTDNTKEIVTSFFAKHKIPGKLVEHKWEDFGTNRTLALDACYPLRKHFDYIWVFDADDLIINQIPFPKIKKNPRKNPDIFSVRFGSGFTYMRNQVFKATEQWKYVGCLHEYPALKISTRQPTIKTIEGDYYIDSRRLGARSKASDKYARDAAVLEKGLLKEPNNERYMFYLGQSYFDAGNFEKSIHWYTKRVEQGKWFEEVYYSLYKIAEAKMKLGKEWPEVEKAYMTAWKYLPSRAEPLYEIAKHYREVENFESGYKYAKLASRIKFPAEQVLFLFKSVYDYQAMDELAICCYNLKKYKECIDTYTTLIKEKRIPESEISRLNKVINLCRIEIAEMEERNEEEVATIKEVVIGEVKYRLSIGLMATLVNDKFKDQIKGCQETWAKEGKSLNVPVKYFCGEIRDKDFVREDIVHLKNVGDDYSSATYKQYYGLRYLLENYPSDFYLLAGSDNYVNIERCLKMLEKYDSKYPFLIGGHGENREIFGYSSHYMTGGAGLFLSHSALVKMAPKFDIYIQQYKQEVKGKDKDACDVSICHFARQESVTLVKEKDLYYCDWKGKCWGYLEFPCGGINYDKMIVCHYMERSDMLLYNYWKDFNYNYGEIFRKFHDCVNTPSDFNEHCYTLENYAKKSSRILSCSYRNNLAGYAFLKGLLDNLDTNVRELICLDKYDYDTTDIKRRLGNLPITYRFIQGNILEHVPENKLDIVFIDTLHVYGQLKRELNHFAEYLEPGGIFILHDTTVDAEQGEAIRTQMNISELQKSTGFSEEELTKGLQPAIDEFLTNNNDFFLEHRYTHNHGLTILRKKM